MHYFVFLCLGFDCFDLFCALCLLPFVLSIEYWVGGMVVVKEVRQGDETGRHGDMETRRDETKRTGFRGEVVSESEDWDGNGDGGRRGRRAEATGGEENVEWRE